MFNDTKDPSIIVKLRSETSPFYYIFTYTDVIHRVVGIQDPFFLSLQIKPLQDIRYDEDNSHLGI